ncbi:MAG: AMP-binding protein, partial [Treponema sp.]|nr:AMP-binding protein [Treponema sp.]
MAAGIACFFTNQAVFLKLYSVAVTSTFFFVFASSLVWGPNIIFRFATMADKSILNSAKEKSVERYCRKVCIAWCLFFILNAGISAFTALKCSDAVWSLYNGGISYALMGLMFAVEYIIRIQVNKKMPGEYSITKFKNDSRKDDYVLCYENTWSSKKYKTWLDFLTASAKVRAFLLDSSRSACKEWILHCEDYWYFVCTFTALLQCGKKVLLTQNISGSFIKEIKAPGVEFLTDQNVDGAFSISNIIEDSLLPSEKEIRTSPAIDADKTEIFMYTSGSTGKPKAVVQRMTEFELDNKFIISKWGDDFCFRRLVTTVSQHHIYGFLFGISLPFTLGTPFRRKRIEYPEEFESLDDGPYMIIATPAFLKRTVEIEGKLPTKDCFIFTSGGVLTPDVAEQTDKVFGFWPLEVYGSTETSGIA